MILDYSQYSLWSFCHWAWYERYVGQRQLRYDGQRYDALALGSLVHNALDNFAKEGKPYVSNEVREEINPTPECIEMAMLLVHGYIQKYPAEVWEVERAEQPLKFPLFGRPENNYTTLEGLAKLDGYFYVAKDTTIESGFGPYITLSKGWWGKEYKTKAHARKRGEWIKEWQTKRQADFQILALDEWIHEKGRNSGTIVQGILVCVLEKPHEHTPRRKCQGCKETWDLASFIPESEGFRCPMCGCVQELSPYVPKVPKVPDFFRITVTRNPTQLAIAKQEMVQVAQEMEAMRKHGLASVVPNRDACVNNVHRRECEYHGPHTYGGTVAEDHRYVQIDATKYMGLPEVA